MRIMHVLAPARAGGLERVVQALAIGQQRRGHEVITVPLIDAWDAAHPFAVPLTREHVEISPVVASPRAYLHERAQLRELFRSRAPDVVHTHNYHADVVAGPVAARADIATIATAHGFTRGSWRNRLYEYIGRVAFRRFDAVIAVSQPLGDELTRSGVPEDRLHVVPNAWSRVSITLDRDDARRELGLDPDSFVIGWVGRMSHEKGVDVLVDAMCGLTDLPVTACAIGDGDERAAQQARSVQAGLDGRIRWTGLIPEAGRLFRAFDVLAISSRTEGVPMVMLEAMAVGIPLVTTAVGGIPDIASDREALLVGPEDPRALAAAIRSVFLHRAAASERANAACSRVNRDFGEQSWLDRHDTVYRTAMTRAVGRSRRG